MDKRIERLYCRAWALIAVLAIVLVVVTLPGCGTFNGFTQPDMLWDKQLVPMQYWQPRYHDPNQVDLLTWCPARVT